MAKKDYSMGFKNSVIDKFSDKFGNNDGGDDPKKMKVTPENMDKVRQGNIEKIKKQIEREDKIAKKNGTLHLRIYKEHRKELTDKIATLQSRMGKQ